MKCDNIQEQLSGYIDNALSSSEKEAIANHLTECPRCRKALTDLEKTVHSIRNLEEVIPPPWLTRKVMARVKSETVKKERGLFHTLFFPLHIKLPIEAVGIVLIAITALYVFKNMGPEISTIKIPSEKTVSEFPEQQKKTPAAGIGGKPSETARLNQFRNREKASPEAPSVPESKVLSALPAEQRMGENVLSLKEESAVDQKHPDKTMMTRSAPLPAGVRVYDKSKNEASTRESDKETAGISAKEDLSLTIMAEQTDTAKNTVQEIFAHLDGHVIKEEATSTTAVIVGELNADKLSLFMQKLKTLDYVKEGPLPQISDKNRLLIKITIRKQ